MNVCTVSECTVKRLFFYLCKLNLSSHLWENLVLKTRGTEIHESMTLKTNKPNKHDVRKREKQERIKFTRLNDLMRPSKDFLEGFKAANGYQQNILLFI